MRRLQPSTDALSASKKTKKKKGKMVFILFYSPKVIRVLLNVTPDVVTKGQDNIFTDFVSFYAERLLTFFYLKERVNLMPIFAFSGPLMLIYSIFIYTG